MTPASETDLRGRPAAFAGGLASVGERVWAWIQPNGGLGEANAGLICGDGASAIVDTTWDRVQARRMLSAMAAHTDAAPIELAVNTHSDGDHWWGNAELPDGVRIVTSKPSLEAITAEPPPAEMARSQRLTGGLSRLPGRPGRVGAYLSERLAPFEFASNEPRPPTESFSGRSTETVGGREVELIEVGPAHTAGDSIVSIPDAGVVFAADVLFIGVTPIMWHGPAANWIAATESLLEIEARIYVPGHGRVGTRDDVEEMRQYWQWFESAVAEHHSAGHGAKETARAMVASSGFEPFRAWRDPERLFVSVTTELRAHAGEPPLEPNVVNRTRMFDGVADLRRRINA